MPIAERFIDKDPNTLTWVSLVFAFLAGVCFYFGNSVYLESTLFPDKRQYILFIVAVLFIFLNGLFDALDGKVARLTGKSSARGDFLDHVVDRFADVFIIGGIAISPYCNPTLGTLSLVTVLLVSYMGTQAQALGCGRNYGGYLGRADRIVILMIAPVFQVLLYYVWDGGRLPMIHLNLMECVLVVFTVLGIMTIIQRGVQTWGELGREDGTRGRGSNRVGGSVDRMEPRQTHDSRGQNANNGHLRQGVNAKYK